jgi:hypothetical protein
MWRVSNPREDAMAEQRTTSAGTGDRKARAARSSNGEAGQPAGAVEGLLQAIADPAPRRSPDPDVSTAFSLGWHLGELRAVAEPHWFGAPDTSSAADDYLSNADDRDRWTLALRRVDVALERLAERGAADAGRGDDPSTKPKERYERILVELMASDATLGKGLGLGRLTYALTRLERSDTPSEEPDESLAETPPLPEQETPVDTALRTYAPRVEAALSDLASALPENAAHSVLNSLRLWWQEKELRRTAADGAVGFVPLDAEFRAQGDRWRSVLSGEVAAKDLVRFRDYLGSIEGLAAQFWEVTKGAVPKFWPLAALTSILMVAGIVMLFFGATDLAGVGFVLAAFGLSWKGIGGLIGRPIAKGEQDLWDAQMDWTIAYRITTLPRESREGVERTLGMLNRSERRRWAHLEDLLAFQERPPAASHSNAPRALLMAIAGNRRR